MQCVHAPVTSPDQGMDPELRAMFQRVTKGALSGNAGQPAKEDFKINGQCVNTPVINGQEGVVGIPFFDEYVEKASLDYLDRNANSTQPLFMSINFMKHISRTCRLPNSSSSRSRRLNMGLCRGKRHANWQDHGQGSVAWSRQEHVRLLDDRQRCLAGRLS
jgi:hypothetical protein